MGASSYSRRERWKEVSRGGDVHCEYCRPHKGENRNLHRPKPDRYKSARKGKCAE